MDNRNDWSGSRSTLYFIAGIWALVSILIGFATVVGANYIFDGIPFEDAFWVLAVGWALAIGVMGLASKRIHRSHEMGVTVAWAVFYCPLVIGAVVFGIFSIG